MTGILFFIFASCEPLNSWSYINIGSVFIFIIVHLSNVYKFAKNTILVICINATINFNAVFWYSYILNFKYF